MIYRESYSAFESDPPTTALIDCMQIYVTGHGDYNLACTTSNSSITPYPKIRARPATCSSQTFNAFLNKQQYTNSKELIMERLYLLWNVSDGEHY
jgi:hypothetical protein